MHGTLGDKSRLEEGTSIPSAGPRRERRVDLRGRQQVLAVNVRQTRSPQANKDKGR